MNINNQHQHCPVAAGPVGAAPASLLKAITIAVHPLSDWPCTHMEMLYLLTVYVVVML